MGYYIDLSSISTKNYKNKLKVSDLLPSRIILKEKIDERFSYFESIGITNLLELQKVLKNKNKFAELSKADGLSEEYLIILLREINSMHPKPNKISEFTGISPETVQKLEKAGIKDTLKLFDYVKTSHNRRELSKTTGISEDAIIELTKLTDLSRIKWAGVTFASMLYEIGIDSVEKAAKLDFTDLHKRINQLNKEKGYFKMQLGINDMKLFVNAAKEVSIEIEY